LVRRALRAQAVRARQGLAILFHLVGAEQFRPQRRRIADVLMLCQAIAAQARPQADRGVAYAVTAQSHFRCPCLQRSNRNAIATGVTAIDLQTFL
jgi:hypothetical protein